MTKDAEKLLKYIINESQNHDNSAVVEVLINNINNIPNIEFAKDKLLLELETSGVICTYDTSEHGEIQVYLTTDGFEYFDALEKNLEPTDVSICVSGSDYIASKKVVAANNIKIEDYQDSSQEKIGEKVNKDQCNILDDIEDGQGHTDIVLSDSIDNNSAQIDDCLNDFRKDECIHESAKKSGVVNNNETVMVVQKSKIWGKYVLSLVLLLILSMFLIIPTRLIDLVNHKDKQIIILDDVVVSPNQSDLTIQDKYIDKDAIKKINKLKYLTGLVFERCKFENNALSYINLPLVSFCMIDCTNVNSYYFLQFMNNLHELKLQNCGITNNTFWFLYIQESISSICLADNVKFTDLSVLPLSNLLNLDFSGTSVSDLSPLSVCENLTQINGSNTLVSDLKPLANLEKLTTIQFDHCAIQEIKDEFMSLRMRNISFECNNITDCSGFSNFTILENVNLSNNKLSEISWLEKSKETLKIAILSNNLLDEEQISFFNDCKSM